MEILQIYTRKSIKHHELQETITEKDMSPRDPLHLKEDTAKRIANELLAENELVHEYSQATDEEIKTWAQVVKTTEKEPNDEKIPRNTKTERNRKETKSIEINKDHIGIIVGKQGAKIKQIEQDFDVKISIKKEGNNKNNQEIEITGNEKDTTSTKEYLLKIIKETTNRKRESEHSDEEQQPKKKREETKIEERPTCKYWQKGTCDSNQCWFRHAEPVACSYYQAGYCKFGPKCTNKHIE